MILLREKVNTYKKKYYDIIEQIEINEKVDNILNSLDNKSLFNKLDIEDLIKLLSKTNIDEKEISKIENTIKYVKINDNLNEFKNTLNSIFNCLKQLKKEVISKKECETNLKKCDELLNSIDNKHYIEDFDFIFQIFKELELDIKQVGEIVKSIDSYNRNVSNTYTVTLKEDKVEGNDKDFVNFILQNRNLFTSREIGNLNKICENDFQRLNTIYDYLVASPNFKVIIDNLKKYKTLFLSLLFFSNVDILKSIDGLAEKYSINITRLLPTFFISEKTITSNIDDEFYSHFVGNYENFVAIVNGLSIDMDITKLINECSALFMTPITVINSNIKLLNEYNISLSPSMLNCLKEQNLVKKIDRFIEAGLYDYLKKFPSILLNNDDALFHRIYYAKKNNISIKKRGLLKCITDIDGLEIDYKNYTKKVPVYRPLYFNNPRYNNVLNSTLNINSKEIESNFEFLKEYEDNSVYNIDGICFSKRKVMRIFNECVKQTEKNNFNNLRSRVNNARNIIFALVSDLILDESDYKKIVLFLLEKLGINKLQVDSTENIPLDVLRVNFGLSNEEVQDLVQKTKGNGRN